MSQSVALSLAGAEIEERGLEGLHHMLREAFGLRVGAAAGSYIDQT
jgi:hypothetical protein